MKDKVKGLLLGIIIGSMITGASAFAANTTVVRAHLKSIGLYVDGVKVGDSNVINYNNAVYVPARSISSAMGQSIHYSGGDLFIGKQPAKKSLSEDEAFEVLYNKLKSDAVKYNLHFMVDRIEGDYYVFQVYEDMETHIATFGWYYVERSSGKAYYWDLADNVLIEV